MIRGEENVTVNGERRRVRYWRCHGLEWELVLTRLYPERARWDPTCPECDMTLDHLGRDTLAKNKKKQ